LCFSDLNLATARRELLGATLDHVQLRGAMRGRLAVLLLLKLLEK
jgi:hypothetical protein